MLDTVVICGEDVSCSVVFITLFGVFVFSVMLSELLMTYNNNNNNNNILFYSANIQFGKNLFSALSRNCVQEHAN